MNRHQVENNARIITYTRADRVDPIELEVLVEPSIDKTMEVNCAPIPSKAVRRHLQQIHRLAYNSRLSN
jgi:hypothetical protein